VTELLAYILWLSDKRLDDRVLRDPDSRNPISPHTLMKEDEKEEVIVVECRMGIVLRRYGVFSVDPVFASVCASLPLL
jgi:hypothetical protein